MKIVQEENIQPIQQRIWTRPKLDIISCLFFILGMFICAYILHYFIL